MQLHNTNAPAMRAPIKAPPRKGARPAPRGAFAAALAGQRRASCDTPRELKKRRIDGQPMLPANIIALLTAPKQKSSTNVYVPMARQLNPEEIQAQIDAESSGEDEDTSDAFYIALHAQAQKRAEAERGAHDRLLNSHRWNSMSTNIHQDAMHD